MFGIGDAGLYFSAGHTNLVDQVAVLRDIGMVRQGAIVPLSTSSASNSPLKDNYPLCGETSRRAVESS